MTPRTFYRSPAPENAYLLFFYKNFAAASTAYSHIGLGVNALHCVKVLRKQGVRADLYGVITAADIDRQLAKSPDCTHCIIQAPWIPIRPLVDLMRRHSHVHFVVRVHSQIAFLQVEAQAVKNIRDMIEAQEGELNLTLSANSTRLSDFLRRTYAGDCLYLANMYNITDAKLPTWRPPGTRDTLRIGSFGATRLMKNHLAAAAAALLIARSLGSQLAFFVSTNRDRQGQGIIQAIRNLFAGLKWATLTENSWEDWTRFRRTVATMDLCMQISMSETFNITTADAAASGIPSVVSDAIEWVPRDWIASIDDVDDVAKTGIWLLSDQYAGSNGRTALVKYNAAAVADWMSYLSANPTL